MKGERAFRGIPVSAGVVRGKVLVIATTRDSVPERSITEAGVADELQRLEQALIKTRQEILGVQQKVAENLGAADANIFDAHLLVLEVQAVPMVSQVGVFSFPILEESDGCNIEQ